MSDLVISSEGRTVVLFTQPATCAPCRAFKPHWDRAVENVEGINFLYVDLDTNPDAMLAYGIRSIPTVKLFEDGTYVRDVKAPQGAMPFMNDIKS